ncbi:MAG: pilus assembly PilX family protein [Burkholderiaceae bacterium]
MNNIYFRSPRSRGFALFSALMFLIVLTVLAVAVLRSTTVNERIAGNDLDRTRALQAAEATLRDAEQDILRIRSAGGTPCAVADPCRAENAWPNPDSGLTDLGAGSVFGLPSCVNGLCYFTAAEYAAAGFVAPWQSTSPLFNASANYGQFSGANWAALNIPVSRPRYWVEVFFNTTRFAPYYRITVLATGLNQNTQVMLQTIYEP